MQMYISTGSIINISCQGLELKLEVVTVQEPFSIGPDIPLALFTTLETSNIIRITNVNLL